MLSLVALAQCLALSYPAHIEPVAGQNDAIRVRGQELSLSAQGHGDSFDRASIRDMLSVPYVTSFTPPRNDPGRHRPKHFFYALYGEPSSRGLQKVSWGNSSMLLKPNAAIALEKVKKEVFQSARLASFASSSLGSYNKRFIAGTTRYSAHAYGLALDLKFPGKFHRYWQWDGKCKENTSCRYPSGILESSDLQDIVRIFEKYGFVWGGRWNHYDTMHFEYRPEIISCSPKS